MFGDRHLSKLLEGKSITQRLRMITHITPNYISNAPKIKPLTPIRCMKQSYYAKKGYISKNSIRIEAATLSSVTPVAGVFMRYDKCLSDV